MSDPARRPASDPPALDAERVLALAAQSLFDIFERTAMGTMVVDREHRTWYLDEQAVRALADREGVSPSVVSGLAANGYRLECGKLCRLDGRPFLHLVYANGARKLSVYVRPRDADLPPDQCARW